VRIDACTGGGVAPIGEHQSYPAIRIRQVTYGAFLIWLKKAKFGNLLCFSMETSKSCLFSSLCLKNSAETKLQNTKLIIFRIADFMVLMLMESIGH
jgi:hypothetical protein